MNKKIAIIGGGNLGSAIALGLVQSKIISPNLITVSHPKTPEVSTELQEKGISVTTDNKEAVSKSEIVIVSVKPYLVAEVLKELSSVLSKKHILISAVAGFELDSINTIIRQDIPIFRIIPNTAIAIQESITFVTSAKVWEEEQKTVVDLFKPLGDVLVIKESQMLAAMVLGSCGTAFALRYMRASMVGGVEIGFDAATSQRIVAQTVKGAALLLQRENSHPEQEIDKVCTPQGYTIVGLNEMEHNGLSWAVINGIKETFLKGK